MERRDFLHAMAAGIAGALGPAACAPIPGETPLGGDPLPLPEANSRWPSPERSALPGSLERTVQQARFDVHPFIRQHPEAVFVRRTRATSKLDAARISHEASSLARELIVSGSTGRYPVETRVVVKPNWTWANPVNGAPVVERMGVTTDANFVEGWIGGMREAGAQSFFLRECTRPAQWQAMGWTALAQRAGADLRDLSTTHVWMLEEGRDYNLVEVPGGVVFRDVAYMAPTQASDAALVNIAKFKSHGMGVTGAVKNLQGLCARRFHEFCTDPGKLLGSIEPWYHSHFQPDFLEHVTALHERHVREGIPRWDRPGPAGGLWMEQWCQRTIDSVSVTPTLLNVVEGIYTMDGDGFGLGPHAPLGPQGATCRDYLSNLVLFGANPFLVDVIAHWIAGHEPGNFGLFHLARERGQLSTFNPRRIPLYLWEDGHAREIALDTIPRTPLVCTYLPRDYNGGREAPYHLCDEPYDYDA